MDERTSTDVMIKEAIAQATEVCRLPVLDMSTWDDGPAPEPDYAVPNRVPACQTTYFTGEGGAGKSIEVMHLSAAAVLGRDWLGVTPRQGPALFIDAEDPEPIMRHRMGKILKHYDACFADVREQLHLVSLVGRDAVLGAFNRSTNRMEATAVYNELLQMAGDLKPSIIGIASVADVFAGNELDRSQVRQFVNMLTRVAIVAGSGLVLVGHPSLTGISSGTGISGSTQWHNACRAQLYLQGVKPQGGEQFDSDLRVLEFKKNQYGPMSESITLRWRDGLFLPVEGATFDAAARGEMARDVFLKVLRRYNTENRSASDKTGTNYAPKLFAGEREAREVACSKDMLRQAMLDLLRDKAVVIEETGRASHKKRELRVSALAARLPLSP